MKVFNFTDIEGRDSVSAMNPIYTYGHEFSRHLAQGLADNWSQVSKRCCFTSVAECSCAPYPLIQLFAVYCGLKKIEN
jgi:hypothetical protein